VVTLTNNTTLTVGTALSGTGGLTQGSGAILNIGGTSGITTLTATVTNTVNYNGAGAQTIKGTTYFNLTLSNAGTKTTTSVTVNGILSMEGTATASAVPTYGAGATLQYNTTTARTAGVEWLSPFAGTGGVIIANTGTITMNSAAVVNATLTIGSGATLDVSASNFAIWLAGDWVNNGGTFTARAGTVTLNGTGTQSIGGSSATTFNSLTYANTTTSYTASTTCSIGGTLTANSSTNVSPSGGTITMNNGSTISNSGTLTFYGLTISGTTSGSGNFSVGGTMTVDGTFTPSAADVISGGGTLTGSGTVKVTRTAATPDFNSQYAITTNTLTNLTVDYDATAAQTLDALNYFNLTISANRGGATVTLGTPAIGISGAFAPNATNVTYATAGNTVDFNGIGAQNVSAFTYNNLVLTNGSATPKTFVGTDSVNGNLVINSGATGAGGSANIVLLGDWTNNGSFSAAASTVELGGVSAATIYGTTTFNALTINKADSVTAVALNDNINVGTLNMTLGMIQTGSNSVTISGTRTGNSLILGTVTRTHTFALSTPYEFEGPNTFINFTAGSTPSSVTVAVAPTTPSSPTMIAVDRSISISTTGGSFAATLRLHYENSETNDLDELGLKLWRDSAGTWLDRGAATRDSVNNYVELADITAFSSWAIGASASSKTLVDNNGGSVNAGDTLAYTVTIVNPYKSTKPTIDVSDPLSSKFILVPGTISNGGGIAGQVLTGMNLEGGTITWPSFSLAGGASVIRTFQLRSDSTISPSQTIANTAQIDYGGGKVEYVSIPVTFTNLPDIAITNAVDNTMPVPGDVLTYTLSVRNNGTSNATNITLNTAIPNNTTFNVDGYGVGFGVQVDGVPKTNASGDDEVTYGGGSITVTISTLSPGTTTQIKFKTTVN